MAMSDFEASEYFLNNVVIICEDYGDYHIDVWYYFVWYANFIEGEENVQSNKQWYTIFLKWNVYLSYCT